MKCFLNISIGLQSNWDCISNQIKFSEIIVNKIPIGNLYLKYSCINTARLHGVTDPTPNSFFKQAAGYKMIFEPETKPYPDILESVPSKITFL